MPHSPHRRRRRATRSRTAWPVVVLAAFLIGFFSARDPLGNAAASIIAATSAVAAFVALSCFTGRALAWLRNGFALYCAQTDLGRFMRTNDGFRAARRGISRPAL